MMVEPEVNASVLCTSGKLCLQAANRSLHLLSGLHLSPSYNLSGGGPGIGLGGGPGGGGGAGVGGSTGDSAMSSPATVNLLDDTCLQASINTFLHRYITPVIIFVGVLGNLVSLAVFRTSRLRRQTSTVHLSALALSDTGFLLTLLLSWLSWFRVNLVHQQPWCVLVVYVTYVCSFLSVWIVVTFTVERFIVACFPLHRKRIVRSRTTKVVLVTLTVLALIAYSFALWMNGVIDVGGTAMCGYYPQYERAVRVLMHVDTVVTFIIPMIILIALNSAIALAIYRTQHSLAGGGDGGGGMGGSGGRYGYGYGYGNNRSSNGAGRRTILTYLEPSESISTYRSFSVDTTNGHAPSPPVLHRHQHQQQHHQQHQQQQKQQKRMHDVVVSLSSSASAASPSVSVSAPTSPPPSLSLSPATCCNTSGQERAKRHIRATKMLLVVSTVFVALNLPVHALKVYAVIRTMVDPGWRQPQAERLWTHTFELVYYCNFAINFFLYSLCVQNFRRCLLACCSKARAKVVCWLPAFPEFPAA